MYNIVRLQHEEIVSLHRCLKMLLTPSSASSVIEALLVGIDSGFVSSLEDKGDPSRRLYIMLHQINTINVLTTDERLLDKLLVNARELLNPRIESKEVINLRQKVSLTTQLIQIIHQSQIDEKELANIYEDCLPKQRLQNYQFSLSEVDTSLHHLFETKIDQYEFGFAACLFASIVGRTSPISPLMNKWIDHAIKAMGWQFSRNDVEGVVKSNNKGENRPGVHDRQELMVRITNNSPNNHGYISADFFKVNEQGNFEKLESIETTVASLSVDIRATLKQYLIDLAFIELLLPKELMHINFEFAEQKRSSLIGQHIVVRRFSERQQTSRLNTNKPAAGKKEFYINRWKRRWGHLFSQDSHTIRQFHRQITIACLKYMDDLCYDLDANERFCCTICGENPQEYFTELLEQHLESGIPVMMWPGTEHTIDEKLDDIAGFLNQPVRRLLGEANQLQKTRLKVSKERFKENNLFFIYDDPNRMLPTIKPNHELSFLEENPNG